MEATGGLETNTDCFSLPKNLSSDYNNIRRHLYSGNRVSVRIQPSYRSTLAAHLEDQREHMGSPETRDLSPTEGLYSTPLSWERPEPGFRQNQRDLSTSSSFDPSSSNDVSAPFSTSIPQPSQFPRHCSPMSSLSPSPKREIQQRWDRRSSDEDSSPSSPTPSRRDVPKKTSHNVIEKRYRNNINDKISALRDSVPSLREGAETIPKSRSRNGNSSSTSPRLTSIVSHEVEYDDPAGPAPKLNKATVLSKATEYIAHLEKSSKSLSKENQQLKQRVDAFESLLVGPSNSGRPIYEIGRMPNRASMSGGDAQLQRENGNAAPRTQRR